MQNPPMFYREENPSGETSHFVFSYWEFKVDDKISAPVTHEIFPDGCISIFFLRSKLYSFEKLSIAGINLKSVFITVNPGDHCWGMRILPEACFAFFGVGPLTIKNQEFDFQTPGKRLSPELVNNLSDCKTFTKAIEVYENYAKNFGVKSEEIDERLAKATCIFVETEGLAKISETAKEIGLSERQFERNYRKASGLTPKQFARICRFRATAIDMVRNRAQNWAHRAAEKGFTDQSHLNREFSSLTGNSPVEFSENVSRIHHEKIIE